jgi:hypothetical protein
MTNLTLNLDHYPVTFIILQNTLIAKKPFLLAPPTPRIPKSIPKEQLQNLLIKLMAENTQTIIQLTHTLQNDNLLSPNNWSQTISEMENLITKLSKTFVQTCAKPLAPILTERTKQQGSFLPRHLQKQWEKQLKIHHDV